MSKRKMSTPPEGSKLKACVDLLVAMSAHEDGDWKKPDGMGEIAAISSLRDDPRIWKQPVEFIRDTLILPSIRSVHGDLVADVLMTHASGLLDEFTGLYQDFRYRHSTESERRAPKSDVESYAIAITVWVFSRVSQEMPDATLTARYNETAKRLGPGIDRHVVKRAVDKLAYKLARVSDDRLREAVLRGTQFLGQTVEEAGLVRKRSA